MLTPISLPYLDPIRKPTLIPIPIDLEHEPLILDSHISLLGNNFESMLTPVSLPNLDPVPKPTLILISIKFEHEPPILDSHIPLLGNDCEIQLYDLDQTHEPTPTLKPKLDLNFIPKSVSVPIPFIVEPKSSISQKHIPLLDQDLDQYDSVMLSLIHI